MSFILFELAELFGTIPQLHLDLLDAQDRRDHADQQQCIDGIVDLLVPAHNDAEEIHQRVHVHDASEAGVLWEVESLGLPDHHHAESAAQYCQ